MLLKYIRCLLRMILRRVALRFALVQLCEKEKPLDKAKQVYQHIINLLDVAPEGLNALVKLACLHAPEQDSPRHVFPYRFIITQVLHLK